jgi:hypothetical protein
VAISRYAAATDAVLAALRADATLAAAAVEIIDGPPAQQAYGTTVLYVGWRGDVDDDTAGDITQEYHDLGPTATRDEIISIYCTVQSVRGDDDMAAARTSAVAALGAIETALRGNVSLGLANVLRIEVSDSTVRQVRDVEGIGVELGFTITVTSLI